MFFIQDRKGGTFGFLGMLCNGTTYHVVALVMVGHGKPQSAICLAKLESQGICFPKVVTIDRGQHNRGAFARGLFANGVLVRQAPLEAPEHIGRGERHCGITKNVMKRLIVEHHIAGK